MINDVNFTQFILYFALSIFRDRAFVAGDWRFERASLRKKHNAIFAYRLTFAAQKGQHNDGFFSAGASDARNSTRLSNKSAF